MLNTETAGYIIWEINGPIWGAGEKVHEAIDDAMRELERAGIPECEYRQIVSYRASRHVSADHSLVYVPASADLIARYREEGGDIRIDIVDGVAVVAGGAA